MARRSLSTRERLRLFTLHGGICHICETKINGVRDAWDISHDIPLELNGADDDKNRQPAHRSCHQARTASIDAPKIAKTKRQQAAHLGAKTRKGRPMAGTRASGWKHKMDGSWIRR